MTPKTVSPLLALVALVLPFSAAAVDFGVRIEPGVAIPLSAPQSDLYGIGGAQTAKAYFGLGRYLDIGPTVGFMLLPAKAELAEGGTAWMFGGGLRLKRPHDAVGAFGISPWLDADALFIRTGNLNRPGFDVAVGLSIPVGETRTFWIGPFVRYTHIGQTNATPGFDNRDAKVLSLGLSFEAGTGLVPPRVEALVAPPEIRTVEVEVIKQVPYCADADADGAPDNVDHCPEVSGPLDNFGCPNYKKVVVKKDKLELKEKLYFAYDKATLEPASFPILDDVVQALKENKGFRVQIEGHTDSSGGETHNQTLSEARAGAVLDYLATHGISKDRLISKGFSSSVPISTNTTVAGRENNRRVEFVVHFIIVPEKAGK